MSLRIIAPLPASEADAPARVRAALIEHYFRDPAWLLTPEGQNDLRSHLTLRLEDNRNRVVPWLEATGSLSGATVLEIGCGTGASTQALSERGASVTAVDIDAASLEVARQRCAAHGLRADFILGNGSEVATRLHDQRFDWILLYASLEHMTHEERLRVLRGAWSLLGQGGLLGVIETPNRLWYRDDHTALLPFYHWLPDDLAFAYARFSPRRGFCDVYGEDNEERRLHFLRRGRGVSFHEFELAIAPVRELEVVGCLHESTRNRDPQAARAWPDSPQGVYQRLLAWAAPDVPRPFLEPQLDLVLRAHQ